MGFLSWFKNTEEAERQEWLAKERLTNAEVLFELNNETKSSGAFKADAFGSGSFSFWQTAEDIAKGHLDACYYRGYFKDSDGNTYPVCNIKKAWVRVYAA